MCMEVNSLLNRLQLLSPVWPPGESMSGSKNSIFLVEDLERNDGSLEKPYYMSKELKKILGKKNKKPKKIKEK